MEVANTLARAAPADVTSPGKAGDNAAFERVEEAVRSLDWEAAYRLFQTLVSMPAVDWMRIAEVAGALQDWRAVLQAEAGLMTQASASEPSDLPARMLRLSIQARRRLEIPRQAVSLIEAMQNKDPKRSEWKKRRAEALVHVGDYEAAIKVGRQLWNANRDFGAVVVATSLIEQGELGECKRFLDEAEALFPRGELPAELLRAQAAYLSASSEHAEALAVVLKLAEHTPEIDHLISVAEHAALAHDRSHLEELFSLIHLWRDDPRYVGHFRGAAPAILEAHYDSFVDWKMIEPLVEALSTLTLAPRSARPMSKMLLQAGNYSLAHNVILKALHSFPSVPGLWRLNIHILTLMGDTKGVDLARKTMKQLFHPDTYLNTMSIAEPRSWDLSELPEFLSFNLSDNNSKRQHKFFASLGEVKLNEAQVELLRAASASGPALLASEVELKLFPMRDIGLLETSVIKPVRYAAFLDTPVRTQRYVDSVTEGARAGQWSGISNDWGMFECLTLTADIQAERAQTRLFTREAYAEASSLARALIERIETRTPTSLIRLGDGEGHFLPVHTASESQKQADRASMLNIWWGTADVDAKAFKAMEDDFVFSVDNCTILAIIPPWRFIAELSKRKFTTVHRGILGGVKYCATMKRKQALVTSMHCPNDLHNWNLWVEIFKTVRCISYISCHNMTSWFRDTFGLEVYQGIHIPGENQFTALFDGEQSKEKTGTLFDRHDEFCSEINPRPGDVYLIAAGWLGKIYCELVRMRGGIAIDIGSLADYWMGFSTRRYRLEQLTDQSLANSLIEDHILDAPTDRLRVVGSFEAARSTADCRYNVATGDDVASMPSVVREQRLLRVVGHPRCASGYMAAAFAQSGIEIGHETMLRDGVAGWAHVVQDFHLPYGEEGSVGVEFEYTVGHVRDPVDAVPSIMLENGRSKSFNFRRLHILRAYDVEISEYRNALDRAVASLVYWYDLVMDLKPDAVLRVEDAEAGVRDYASKMKLTHSVDFHFGAGDEAQSPPGVHQLAAGGADVMTREGSVFMINNAATIFGRPKPELLPQDYANLDHALREKLALFCDRFGYREPWRDARF